MLVGHAAQASEISPEVREDKIYVCGLLREIPFQCHQPLLKDSVCISS
jgi:hypothetical protein